MFMCFKFEARVRGRNVYRRRLKTRWGSGLFLGLEYRGLKRLVALIWISPSYKLTNYSAFMKYSLRRAEQI